METINLQVFHGSGTAEWSGYQDDGAKNGSDFFQRFGHKIGPKAFPDVILAWLDRKFRPGSF